MTRLRVEADLSIEVGGTKARLTSDGSRLVLQSADPERIWAAVLRTGPPPGLGPFSAPGWIARVAEGMSDSGLRLDVVGPNGSIVHLGEGVDSRLGGLVAGSRAIAAETPAVLAVLLRRRGSRAAAAGALAATVIAGLAWWIRAATRA